MSNSAKTILVIDDEVEIRELLKEFLEDEGFKVIEAKDGIKAQECLEEKLPDIVVIDLLLPGEHGITLVKTIKEKYFIPVIIISGVYKRDELQDMMDEHFVEGFLEKPISMDVLLGKIRAIIDERTL
jgi:DNA-binding response OmpR family regulator